MPDAALLWGGDLTSSPVGDIATSDGPALSQQRLLRRLLTNPGDYIWHPDYGAGLAQFIGSVTESSKVRSVIRAQIFLESTVTRLPEPVINIQSSPDGSIYVEIAYFDSTTGSGQTLSFSVST